MTTKIEATALYCASMEAWDKVKRNADKLAWMDATRHMGDVVIALEADLARYEAEAKEAASKFAAAVTGWSAEDIVAAIAA